MEKFNITIVNYPAKYLVGVKVRTNMQKAKTDCPALWQSFGPQINVIPSRNDCCSGAYGVSFMLSENDFDYWAAVAADSDTTIPNGMFAAEIPAGLYVKCPAASLEKLSDAYKYVYGQWVSTQKEYAVDFSDPCFEFYPPNWDLSDALDIYVPVKKL